MTYDGEVDAGELWELEHQGWVSLCRGAGADFYGKLMTDEAVMVLAHGFVLDRATVVASLNDAPAWDDYEISDERLIEVDEHTAALVYTGRASRAGEPEFHALMSSIYTRLEGRWRMTLYQQTPVPPVAH